MGHDPCCEFQASCDVSGFTCHINIQGIHAVLKIMRSISYAADLSHPQMQALVLVMAGLALLWFRHRRMAVLSCSLAIGWLLLCATPGFARLLQLGLVHAHPRLAAFTYPAADAIVVLGGGTRLSHYRNGADLSSTRTGFGLELFREGRAPIVLVSGGRGEAIEMADDLRRLGVPPQSLRVESTSTNTRENAVYSSSILRRENRQRILLVTSAWSMSRAAASFRREGLEVIPAPSFDLARIPPGAAWLPQRAALEQCKRFLREYLGLFVYKLRGWA